MTDVTSNGVSAELLAQDSSGTSTVGYFGSQDSAHRGGAILLPNLAIPQGATITAASLAFTNGTTHTAGSAVVQAIAADDAALPNSSVLISSLTLTAASTIWTLPIAAATTITGLAAVVQEVVRRPGWASGNSIVIVANASTDGGNWYQAINESQYGTFAASYSLGPSWSVWDGTTEQPATATVWDGSAEQAVTTEVYAG